MLEKEIWRDIKKFKGLYQVSTLGRVRITGTDVIIKPKMKHDILKVALVKNNRCSILDIHQIVAETFIPKVEGKTSVVHIDGNYENNCIQNLKWGTPGEALRVMRVV